MLQLEELQSAQYITINGERLAIIKADIWERLLNQYQTNSSNITPLVAQRKVTSFVIDQISNLMHGAKPTLITANEQLYWRVPIILSMPPNGDRGQIGTIDIHAQTGELVINPTLLEEINQRANTLVTTSTLPTTA
jgi:hypothetical protein